jgi:post-segregation antitoxin (ccd killing protein)
VYELSPETLFMYLGSISSNLNSVLKSGMVLSTSQEKASLWQEENTDNPITRSNRNFILAI